MSCVRDGYQVPYRHTQAYTRRVSFRPRDEICEFQKDLHQDDAEFIEIAEIVYERLERLKRDKSSGLIKMVFRNKYLDSADDVRLTSETLKRFKKALFLRLDDDYPTSQRQVRYSAREEMSSTIQSLITKILRYVDEVGWPETDANAEYSEKVSELQMRLLG